MGGPPGSQPAPGGPFSPLVPLSAVAEPLDYPPIIFAAAATAVQTSSGEWLMAYPGQPRDRRGRFAGGRQGSSVSDDGAPVPSPTAPLSHEPPRARLKVGVGSGVSPEFRQEVVASLSKIPKSARDYAASHGVSVATGRFVTEVRPELKGVQPRGYPTGATWDNAEGLYHPKAKQVIVSEKRRKPDGTEVPSNRVAGVIRHEFGHAVDFANPQDRLSNRPDFVKIYEQEASAARSDPNASKSLRYFLQAGEAGRQEAFAEGFGILHGGGGSGWSEEQFRKSFPGTLAAIRKTVRDL